MPLKKTYTWIIIAALLCAMQASAQKPVLIEFGWDYPAASELNQNLDSIQNTPFDGICFSLQRTLMEAFDSTIKKDDYFNYAQLKKLKWGRYKNNYLILRGYSKTGGNWLSDGAWENITANMKKVSKAMQAGKLKGILFDPEYYNEDKLFNPWTYSNAQYPSHSFEEMQAIVRKRGSQFVTALQQYKKDMGFLSIWITSFIAREKINTPYIQSRHALLLSFIEGMLLKKAKTVKITDGNEYAYWNNKPSDFLGAGLYLKKNIAELMITPEGKKLSASVQVAQTVYYDGALGKTPSFERGIANTDKWAWLAENLKFSMASTDRIVWFYSERLNWWNRSKVNDTLSNLISTIKSSFVSPSNTPAGLGSFKKNIPDRGCNNFNTGKGCFYTKEDKRPMLPTNEAFSFVRNKKNNTLVINFKNKLPSEVSIFINNKAVAILKTQKQELTYKLTNFTTGKIGILAKYSDYTEANSLQFY